MMGRSEDIAMRFVEGLDRVVGRRPRGVPLHEPEFTAAEAKNVEECVSSGWVSSVGRFVDEFEAGLASYTGSRHAIAVVNGTAALHVALSLAGVATGDEVLVPALTFVATANAVAHCGAVPHFVDSSAMTLGIDPVALRVHLDRIARRDGERCVNLATGRRIAAVVPMHTFGHPVDMPALIEVAAEFGLPIVEDAAESLGSRIGDRHTGTVGLLGTLSFNGNKVITTGGGGAILTDDDDLARAAKHLTTTAKVPHRWDFFHDAVAWNYRMPNLNAALGCAQLERLTGMLARKRALAADYLAEFECDSRLIAMREPPGTISNYWLNAVTVAGGDRRDRDAMLSAAADAGYLCRPCWTLLCQLPMYRECPRAPLPVAEAIEETLVNVPSGAGLRVASA